MSDDIIVEEEYEEYIEIQTAVSPTNTSRRLIMAGIGFAVIIRSELATTIDKIVEQSANINQNQPPQNPLSAQPIRKTIKKPVSKLLHRLNIPTKSDIDTLNNQIANLLDKVDALQTEPQFPEAEQTESPPNEI